MNITLKANNGTEMNVQDHLITFNHLILQNHSDDFYWSEESQYQAWAKVGDFGQPQFMKIVLENIRSMIRLYPECLQQLMNADIDVFVEDESKNIGIN